MVAVRWRQRGKSIYSTSLYRGQHGFDSAVYTQTDSQGGSTGPEVESDI